MLHYLEGSEGWNIENSSEKLSESIIQTDKKVHGLQSETLSALDQSWNLSERFDTTWSEQWSLMARNILIWIFRSKRTWSTSSSRKAIEDIKNLIFDTLWLEGFKEKINDENREFMSWILVYIMWKRFDIESNERKWGIADEERHLVLMDDNDEAIKKIFLLLIEWKAEECDEYLWRSL